MTQCDLNAIRERFLVDDPNQWGKEDTQGAICDLMAEVEALRSSAVKVGELYNERCEEVQSSNALYTEALIEIKALRAKLEKAKGILRSEKNDRVAINLALAKLEKL